MSSQSRRDDLIEASRTRMLDYAEKAELSKLLAQPYSPKHPKAGGKRKLGEKPKE